MLAHLHVKNLALIEEIEVEFGPGLNILTGETGAGKSILLGSMQLILGAKTSKNMIRENASYALVELLFQVENEKALETLKALDICPEDGQVLLSRKIMDGRSINKINGETSTVGQMKAAAACLLDIHGQHEHQSLLYQDKQLAILDAYGKEKILPAKEKVSLAYKEYSKCKTELGSMNMNEEQRNRELAFLEFEIKEIEKALLRSDLGITPSNDGKVIRLAIPALTEERRKEMAKLVKKRAEEKKVVVRQLRRDANEVLKKLEKDKKITEDDFHQGQEKIQKITDDFIKSVDELTAKKEQELLQI